MVKIGMYLLKELHHITLVIWNNHVTSWHKVIFHAMKCVTIFLSHDIKQDIVTTAAHSKHIIELLKNRQIIFADISTILENTYGCADQ